MLVSPDNVPFVTVTSSAVNPTGASEKLKVAWATSPIFSADLLKVMMTLGAGMVSQSSGTVLSTNARIANKTPSKVVVNAYF